MNGSMSAAQMLARSLVNRLGSSSIFLPRSATRPSANPACTMFAPSIAPYPMLSEPARNPDTELIISGADAAIATTTVPIIASDSPSFFAYDEIPSTR